MAGAPDTELDSLLDDALNGFTPAASSAAGEPLSAAAPAPPLAFNPLGGQPPKSAKKGKGGASAASVGGTSAAHDAQTDAAARELTDGLARLMQQLGQGARLGGDEAGEEDIQATIAALEAQTRFTTGSSADTLQGVDDVAAGPSGGLPPGMDEAAYQAMLGQLEQLGADPSMASMLESMMAQLLSKEVLYEPLQQISARYPSWLAHAHGAISAEDHARYSRQSALVAQLLAVFDSAPEDTSRVMALMQEMQACGAPPQAIMTEIAPGLTFAADGAPQFPAPGADGGGVPPELAASCAQM